MKLIIGLCISVPTLLPVVLQYRRPLVGTQPRAGSVRALAGLPVAVLQVGLAAFLLILVRQTRRKRQVSRATRRAMQPAFGMPSPCA